MAVKDIFRRMRPVQLYVMLALTALFFLAELIVSHVTHALTLLVDSYHMLCNLIALIGCIATVKYEGLGSEEGFEERLQQSCSKESISGEELRTNPKPTEVARRCDAAADGTPEGCMSVTRCHGNSKGSSETLPGKQSQSNRLVSERRLRNTFGWARIDVLVLMIGTVFLASLCFSLIVEALQTLCHIGHSDEMHHPIPVLCIGAAGILLNGLCYLLIGGYTFHQGSFLHVTSSGDVVLERAVPQDSVRLSKRCTNTSSIKKNEKNTTGEIASRSEIANTSLSPSAITSAPSPAAAATSYLQAGVSGTPPLRQGPREMFRDVIGCVLVIVCSLTVYFTDASVAKYADPIISIFSAILLLFLSYPYMKESGLILLQTIPDHINIESLRSRLCKAFAPVVVGVHDLHIWQLTPQRTYATAHVVFTNSKDVSSVIKQVTEFFHEQGISHVTIQPEFLKCRAVSIPNEETPALIPGYFESNAKTEKCKSYTITMTNDFPKNGERVICFLKCTGRGESCSNLHCCNELKSNPLASSHHHHQMRARYRRRHSLDDALEQVVSDLSSNAASSSSPSINVKKNNDTECRGSSCNRRSVSDNILENSVITLKVKQKSEGNLKDKEDVDKSEPGVEFKEICSEKINDEPVKHILETGNSAETEEEGKRTEIADDNNKDIGALTS